MNDSKTNNATTQRPKKNWGVVPRVLIACFIIVVANCCSQSVSDNVKVYQTYEEVLKDAPKYKDTELSRFFENEDICGVAIFENGSIKYFSVEEFDENTWRLKDGALVVSSFCRLFMELVA